MMSRPHGTSCWDPFVAVLGRLTTPPEALLTAPVVAPPVVAAFAPVVAPPVVAASVPPVVTPPVVMLPIGVGVAVAVLGGVAVAV